MTIGNRKYGIASAMMSDTRASVAWASTAMTHFNLRISVMLKHDLRLSDESKRQIDLLSFILDSVDNKVCLER